MQSSEKIPWNNDGARQAQVDCHWPVPKVIPAAIKAPTLPQSAGIAGYGPYSLIKVIEETGAPRTPSTGECLGEIDTTGDARQSTA